jgi:protein-L-isoaspartate(D-aspartate) O-methyltransferase
MNRAVIVLLLIAFTGFQIDDMHEARDRMVDEQIIARGIKDLPTINAMRKVQRHLFVPPELSAFAYRDHPLSIGYGQTISQPYIVAYMTDALALSPDDKVLEIGTGSGYQAAILAEIVAEVVTIEIVEPLALAAKNLLENLGYKNVTVIAGDGYKGYPERAPFDAIIVTAAPENIPPPLLEQLAEGGRMIIPVGPVQNTQYLVLAEKKKGKIQQKKMLPVRFVPFTGVAEE